MSDAPKLLLDHHLKTLKLPTFLTPNLRASAPPRGIKAAKLPTTKSPVSFDFRAIPSLNKMQVFELAHCEWIERRQNR